MKLVAVTWHEQLHTLHVIFESKALIGFDSRGYKRYEERKHTQLFFGMTRGDCERLLEGYMIDKERYTRGGQLFKIVGGIIQVDCTI